MKLKCISPRLNFVVFDDAGAPCRVRVGDTFNITGNAIPAKWRGLVSEVAGRDAPKAKVAVTNPAAPSMPPASNIK